MFIRLLKHQLKSSWKEFNFSYAILLVFSILYPLSIKFKIDNLITLMTSLFSISIMVSFVLFIYFCIRLFYSSTYGKQGYLTFVLPVSTHSLLLSRILSIFIYVIGYVITFVLSIFIFLLILDAEVLIQILPILGELFEIINFNPLLTMILIIFAIISFFAWLVTCQFVFAAANCMPSIKNKIWIIILMLWGLSSVFSTAETIISLNGLFIGVDIVDYSLVLRSIYVNQNFIPVLPFFLIIMEIAKLICFYFLTVYLINRKIEIR